MFLYNLTLQKAGAITVRLFTLMKPSRVQKLPRSTRPRSASVAPTTLQM